MADAISFMDKAKALTDANKITPETQTFDESKSTAGRVNSIISEDSPLMQLAATRGTQAAAKRGLTNSSIGVQSAQAAVLDAATPIASQDAGLSAQQDLANQAAKNTANNNNAQLAVSAGTTGMQLGESGRQFDATQATNKEQFGQTLDLQKQQLGESARQFDVDIARRANEFGLTQAQTASLAQLDADTKIKLQQLSSDATNSSTMANAWGTMVNTISTIQNNPNIEQAAKATLIQNQIDSFQSYANFWKKANDPSLDISDLMNFGIATVPVNNPNNPAPVPYDPSIYPPGVNPNAPGYSPDVDRGGN